MIARTTYGSNAWWDANVKRLQALVVERDAAVTKAETAVRTASRWMAMATRDAARAEASKAEVARLRGGIKALHFRHPEEGLDRWCHGCGKTWPCPTISTLAPVDALKRCWCGGEVGPRFPGDADGLGCLDNIMHDWAGGSGS